jgi:hypothetical protein
VQAKGDIVVLHPAGNKGNSAGDANSHPKSGSVASQYFTATGPPN